MNDEVRKYLEKSDHALLVAEVLSKSGHAPDAASKTYYAMFYAAQALLKSEGIDVIKHSAVESAFGYYFAKPGRIDPRYHKMLINARRVREIADYDIDEEIVEPEATLKLEEGRAFLAKILELLGA
jgi:uncharacterized protein (UPF0332 family)